MFYWVGASFVCGFAAKMRYTFMPRVSNYSTDWQLQELAGKGAEEKDCGLKHMGFTVLKNMQQNWLNRKEIVFLMGDFECKYNVNVTWFVSQDRKSLYTCSPCYHLLKFLDLNSSDKTLGLEGHFIKFWSLNSILSYFIKIKIRWFLSLSDPVDDSWWIGVWCIKLLQNVVQPMCCISLLSWGQ